MVWFDTGTLLSLARRPIWLNRMVLHLGARGTVVSSVAREIRNFANVPAARRNGSQVLRGSCADVVVPYFNDGRLAVISLSPSDAFEYDRVLAQLQTLEAARGNSSTPAPASALRHAGEAATIAAILGDKRSGPSNIFITSDGGASIVAESNRVDSKHIGDFLAELVCADPAIDTTAAYSDLIEMTRDFGTPPESSRTASAGQLACRRTEDGECLYCQQRP